MNCRKLRLVENLILLMFPVSLLVACTTNGTDQEPTNKLSSTQETLSIVRQENPIFYADQNDLMFSQALTEKVNSSSEMSWAIGENDEDKYVIISPSMHLAVYKTSQNQDADMKESVQTANFKDSLKESNDVTFPDKSIFHFNSDDYNVEYDDILSLKEHAEFLLDNPQFNLTVSGHTDHIGSANHNQTLSEQRAQLIMDILITYGAPKTQIMSDGYGESVPLNKIENLEENRRVELEYSRALMVSEM